MPSEIWVNKKMFSFIFLIYLFTAPLLTLESDSELLCFKAQGDFILRRAYELVCELVSAFCVCVKLV